MDKLLAHWRSVVTEASVDLGRIDTEQARWRPAAGKWSVAEIIGHLIDSAINNHYRFIEAQLRPELVFPGYQQDAWVQVQAYQVADWPNLVQLWLALNLRLIDVVATIPLSAITQPRPVHNLDELAWQPVSRSEVTTLGYFIADYVGHLGHHVAQARHRMAVQAGEGANPR